MNKTKVLSILTVAMVVLVISAACARTSTPTGNGSGDFQEVGFVDGTSNGLGLDALGISPSFASFASNGSLQQGIFVSGTGAIAVTPDLALLNLGVQVTADTVQEALNQANGSLSAMLAVLDSHGIEEKDTQTRSFNIQPRYSFREITRCNDAAASSSTSAPAPAPASEPMPPLEVPVVEIGKSSEDCFVDREQVLIGYQVTNQLTAKVRDLDDVGPVIDSVVVAGGNNVQIQGISFTIEDTSALSIQAREAAVKAAMAQAEQFAELTGVELGKLVHISQSGGAAPIARVSAQAAFFNEAIAMAPTAVRTGELEVTVMVQALFAIQ
jgi:uncharacterized protein YggE